MARKGVRIWKRKDGRWETKIKVGDKRKSIYGKTKKEVKEKLRNLNNSANGIKFLEQSEAWLKQKRNTIKESSYTIYFCIVKKYLNPFFGEILVNKIDKKMIESFKNSLNNELNNRTKVEIIRVLNAILCFQKEKITALDSKATMSNDCSKKKILTKEEFVKFIKYLGKDTDLIKLGILLLICTGIKIGELCALKWENIRIQEGYVIINKTVQDFSKKDVNRMSKKELAISKVKERKIPLMDFLQDELAKQEKSKNCFLLTGTLKWYDRFKMEYELKQILKDASLKDDFTFTELRNSFIVIAIESGMDLRALCDILGIDLNSIKKYLENIPIKDTRQEIKKLCLI